jgi:hypothetical protein
VSEAFRKVLLVGIVLMQLGLLSNCGSSSSTTEMPGVSLSIAAPSTSADVGQTVQFTATVTGTSNNTVTWAVNGATGGNSSVGTISSTGMYTAPGVPPSPNAVTVQATSAADTTKMASANLTISNPTPQASSISPAAIGIGGNGAQVPATGTLVTISGSGFASQSVVTANSTPLATTLVSATELTATIPANLVARPAVVQLAVSTPAPGGGTSSTFSFTVLSVGQVASTKHPQVAQYSITPPRDANVTVQFGLDTSYGLQTWSQPTPSGGGTVNMLVAGMRGSTTYHMRAMVSFPDGSQYTDPDQTFTTGGLPATRVPPLTVTVPSGPGPSGGVELLSLTPQSGAFMAVATDLEGNVIWYYDFDGTGGVSPYPIKGPLPNGHMIIVIGFPGGAAPVNNSIQEIDLAGNIISEFTIADLNADLASLGSSLVAEEMHHDVAVLPNGHWIVLFNTFQNVDGIQISGDGLLDLDPNKNPVWLWSAFDHLDVSRQPFGTDWTHSNAIIYSPNDHDLILSMRNQNWVIKIDYQDGTGTGNIKWRLGPGGDFALKGGQDPVDWNYAQHYPFLISPNSSAGVFQIGLFDNGNNRVLDSSGVMCGTPGAAACYSSVPIFQIDELGKTAQLLSNDKLSVFSACCGDMEVLPSGNIEYDIAAYVFTFPFASRIQEVTPGASPQVVWEMDVLSQLAYRGLRIPSLYPGVQW